MGVGSEGGYVSRLLMDLAAGRFRGRVDDPSAALVAAAQQHGLMGILADHSDHPMVRGVAARLHARGRVMVGHSARLIRRAAEDGVEVAVLKGPYLAHYVYQVSRHRVFSDIDLLVRPEHVDRMMRLLGSDPYLLSIPSKVPKAAKREILLADPSGVQFAVDLHWDLFSYRQLRGGSRGATPALWGGSSAIREGPLAGASRLPDAGMLCFLACHTLFDHRFRLVLFRDFVEFTRGPIDWEAVVCFAGRWALRSPTYVALYTAGRLFGAAVPEDVLTELRPSTLLVRYLERALPETDLVTFDGHRAHPVNLAAVLLHDRLADRAALTARAPLAVGGWRRRVVGDPRRRMRIPKVLMVVSTNRRRGAEVASTRLAGELNGRGWRVDVVSLTASTEDATVPAEPLTAVPPGRLRPVDPTAIGALRRRIREGGYDLVVAYGGTLRPVMLAAWGTGVRVVHRSIGEPDYWARSGWRRQILRWMLRRCDLVLAVSKTTGGQLLRLEPKAKVEVVPDGVPEGLFRTERGERGPELRVLFVGSLTPEKDPLAAVRAVAGVPEAVLRMVGAGELAGEVGELARRLGVRVEMTGTVEDPAYHYGWADVLVVTSRTEGLPGVVLEAAAVGVPTVGFDVGGVREAAGPGGLLVEAGDTAALGDALARLARDRSRILRLGEAARHHVREGFRLDRTATVFARHLEELVSR